MKRIFLLAAFCAITVYSKAQNAVLFKMRYLPNRSYSSTEKTNMTVVVSYDGDLMAEARTKANASIYTGPMEEATEADRQFEIKTGAVNHRNEFPFHIILASKDVKKTVNGRPEPPRLPGKPDTVRGKCNTNGVPEIDSIPGKRIPSLFNKWTIKSFGDVTTIIKFPSHGMKVGDTFTSEEPFNMPDGGSTSVSLKKVYKLISVTARKANFDVDINVQVNIKKAGVKHHDVDVKGSGMGKLEYDMAASFPTHTIQDLNITLTSNEGKDLRTKIKTQIHTDKKTVVK